jgi:uncharacterized protein HemY
MKSTIVIAFLLFLASCASPRLERKIADQSFDSLSDETFLRYNDARLSESKTLVSRCYKGESEKVLKEYREKFLKKDQDSEYWVHIGNCYFVSNQWSKSEFYYQLALDSKKKSIQALAMNNLGLLSFKYEQWERGKEFLQKAMVLAPHSKVPRFNMAQLYIQFGHYKEALDLLNSSMFKGKRDVDVMFSFANIALYQNDLQTAEKWFKEIPVSYLKREDIAITYSLYLIRKGLLAQAQEVLAGRERSQVPQLTEMSAKAEKILKTRLGQQRKE